MRKMLAITACAVLMSTTFAVAQSSQGKGGAAVTGESADPTKTPGGTNQSSKMNNGAAPSGMTSGPSGMGGANKNGDGQMTKGGANK